MNGVRLGETFVPGPALRRPPDPPPPPDPLAARLDALLGALDNLRGVLAAQQPPQVHVGPPDLSAIVTAVNSLKPSVGAEEIATAIGNVLAPIQALETGRGLDAELLAEVRDVLKTLEFRMKGSQPAFGASGPSNIASDPARLLGHVTVDNLLTLATQVTLAAVLAKLNATLAVTQSGSWDTIPDRPSQKAGRFHVGVAKLATSGSASVYTVTPGKTFYVAQINVTVINASSLNIGDLRVQDGLAALAPLKVPVVVPTAVTGGQSPMATLAATFLEPRQFTSKLYVRAATGALTWALSASGYEE